MDMFSFMFTVFKKNLNWNIIYISRVGKKPFKSLGPQVNSIEKVEVHEKNTTNGDSSLHSREKIDKESLVVKSNTPSNTNIQAVNVS